VLGRIKRHEGRGNVSEEIEKKSEGESNVGRMTESCRRAKDLGNYKGMKETK
jgi:hypothetical protein